MTQTHWFDRLTERITRRDALKVAAATGLALALPRPQIAQAGSIATGSCYKGCVWTAHQTSTAARQGCHSGAVGTYYAAGLAASIAAGPLGLLAISLEGAGGADPGTQYQQSCLDQAVLQEKADVGDCVSDASCGDFDPRQPGAPCDDCTGHCCPFGATVTGYICCAIACDATNGCKATAD